MRRAAPRAGIEPACPCSSFSGCRARPLGNRRSSGGPPAKHKDAKNCLSRCVRLFLRAGGPAEQETPKTAYLAALGCFCGPGPGRAGHVKKPMRGAPRAGIEPACPCSSFLGCRARPLGNRRSSGDPGPSTKTPKTAYLAALGCFCGPGGRPSRKRQKNCLSRCVRLFLRAGPRPSKTRQEANAWGAAGGDWTCMSLLVLLGLPGAPVGQQTFFGRPPGQAQRRQKLLISLR